MSIALAKRLASLGACADAVVWVRAQTGTRQAIWNRCRRADWMLWIAAKTCGKHGSPAHRHAVLAACACARTALRFAPQGETRPLAAIELSERWANGDDSVTVEMLAAAGSAAWAAARAAAGAAAWAAAKAAARDAGAAGAAAWAAARDAAQTKAIVRMAKIVRQHIPKVPKLEER